LGFVLDFALLSQAQQGAWHRFNHLCFWVEFRQLFLIGMRIDGQFSALHANVTGSKLAQACPHAGLDHAQYRDGCDLFPDLLQSCHGSRVAAN
jgi:hypothetical protein